MNVVNGGQRQTFVWEMMIPPSVADGLTCRYDPIIFASDGVPQSMTARDVLDQRGPSRVKACSVHPFPFSALNSLGRGEPGAAMQIVSVSRSNL